ncbi:glycosyltransferase family 4 protein [Mariniflexile litorale]|uniref:Glycosyltransferase family 4 protein n=1 Tax=Mariniflexile litorale TaxID=3045158 RepID=A0AAU7EGG1_9FLAO|nr:glycosyltransferase family 4 protein [Mariniflexile sp. KMM 9835]MDQ8211508.1 glycosyltransferase family 4 protein [Mariniflexile sp. KMM 9835]
MKLLYITNQISAAAGLERVLSIKASALADTLGYEVHIITLNQGNQELFYKFSDKIIHHDLNINNSKIGYLFNYIKKIKATVKEINPDVISVCDDGLKGFYLPIILKKKYPIIYERHASKYISLNSKGWKQKLKLQLQSKLMQWGAKSFDAFIVLTKSNVKEWKLSNIRVIPNPLSFYPSETSSLLNKKVIAVGSHYHQKGFDMLLHIWATLSPQFPDWELNIYGQIDTQETYLKLAKKLKINQHVHFHMPVKNIGDKYQEASIYAMTSRSEGFGMVLIEAMAYGVPCVSFDCPSGPRDIISNNNDGFLIPPENETLFAEKLKLLMSNKQTRLKMGECARTASKNYLPNQIILQWDALFKMLTK